MKLLISGEGPSDLGACNNAQGQCSDEDFNRGPMAVWLARLWETLLNYNLLDTPEAVVYVTEKALSQKAKESGVRMQRQRGKKQAVETSLYFSNAQQLGLMAQQLAGDHADTVLAKKQWSAFMGSPQAAAQEALWCAENPADWENMRTMQSFKAFFHRFHEVASAILRPGSGAV